jgi:glutamate synthase (NADPH/NADH) small chain
VEFVALTRALRIEGNRDQFVSGIACDRMDYADPEADGKWRLVPVPGSEFLLEAETVIVALGHKPNMALYDLLPGLTSAKDGTLWVREKTMQTPLSKVYAAGDVLSGKFHVVESMASGRKSAGFVAEGLASS